MKTTLGLVVCVLALGVRPVIAQTHNPYMPGGASNYGIGDDQRQQIIQNLMSGLTGGASPQGDDAGEELPSQQSPIISQPIITQPVTPQPAPVADDTLEKLKAGLAQGIMDVARERSDRAFEIKALKDVLEAEIQTLKKKIDDQQKQIEALQTAKRY